MNYSACLLVAMVSLATPALALERSASANATEAVSGLEQRMEATEARISTAYNLLAARVASIEKCQADTKSYAPSASGADADGCVASSTVPVGTIAGFHLTACPSGWNRYAAADGRFLVGYGSADGKSYSVIGGTTDAAGDAGEAMHQLTISEMPAHRHDYMDHSYTPNRRAQGDDDDRVEPKPDVEERTSKSAGGNQPHENRPPFTVVLWCVKS